MFKVEEGEGCGDDVADLPGAEADAMTGEVGVWPSVVQRSILRLLYVGHTDAAIARRLRIGERTVREHITRMADAAGIQGRFALGVEAERRGWLEGEGQ